MMDVSIGGKEAGNDDFKYLSESLLPTSDGDQLAGEEPQHQPVNDTFESVGELVVDPLHERTGLDGPASGAAVAENQKPEYRDVPFAILFIANLLVISGVAWTWGLRSLSSGTTPMGGADQGQEQSDDANQALVQGGGLGGIIWLSLFTIPVSLGISALSLEFMTQHAEQLIQFTVVFSCTMLGLLVFALLAFGDSAIALFCLLVLVLASFYACSVWSSIPFAAANLRTALSAIQTNYGVCLLAYTLSLLALFWVPLWSLACLGLYYRDSSLTCQDDMTACQTSFSVMRPSHVFLLILSYHWTAQVLKNILHVTIAGVVGTWWFAPQEANSLFSPAVQDSFKRATTFSFGSICMGSLLVALVETLHQIAHSARRHNRSTLLLCVLDCILGTIKRVSQYFNKWSFVYIGLYGYDYLSAGKKVLALFRSRGWTAIVRTMMLVCVVNGALAGLVGVFLAWLTGWAEAVFASDNHSPVFFLCFSVGFSLALIVMSVVCSAVDTVVVGFAEAPAELQMNHPNLYEEMTTAWRKVYPDECRF